MVFCFGELLLRMSPALQGKWIQDHQMPIYIGGAELNVATALSKWDVPTQYFTALPDNYISGEILTEIKSRGIDISPVQLIGDRIGVYFLPQGADLKNSGVIYDRSHSSFSILQPGMINWKQMLQDASWFHCSAISPALNENVAAICSEALEAAATLGITVSIDLNFRSKLWKYGKRPQEIMPGLVQYCNVIMGNIWAASDLLGIHVENDIHSKGSKQAYLDHAQRTSDAIMNRFPNCKSVANTFRFDETDGLRYYATLNMENQQYVSPEFYIKHVVDKVGSGDCFMGGLIHGLYTKQLPQHVIDFAAAAAFGKLQEQGDTTNQHIQDVNKILEKEWIEQK